MSRHKRNPTLMPPLFGRLLMQRAHGGNCSDCRASIRQAQNTRQAFGRSCRRITGFTRRIVAVPVAAPLPNIAMHIMQAPCVGLLLNFHERGLTTEHFTNDDAGAKGKREQWYMHCYIDIPRTFRRVSQVRPRDTRTSP